MLDRFPEAQILFLQLIDPTLSPPPRIESCISRNHSKRVLFREKAAGSHPVGVIRGSDMPQRVGSGHDRG